MKTGKWKYGLLILALSGSVLLGTGCSDYVGKEKSHPLFVKGGNCKNSGNYTDAAKSFEEFLLICPKSAQVHYELASLYGDNLDDPFKALYHYEKYAELKNLSTEDAQDIRQMIESSRKHIYEKLKEEYRSDDVELGKLRNLLVQYKRSYQIAVDQNQQLRERLKNSSSTRSAAPRTVSPAHAAPGISPVSTTSAPSTTAAFTPSAASTAPVSSASVASTAEAYDTYVVKNGDTLIKIARQLYGSGTHYKLILNANKDQVGETGSRLLIGQRLRIPKLPAKSR